jgi:hypothetical protein
VANRAVRTILSLVFIILLVARITIRGRAFELLVDVTGLTSHLGMFTFQLECHKVVVECRGYPAVRSMALAAIGTKAALVRLIVEMTGIAILRGRGELDYTSRIDVTLNTSNTHMLAAKFECRDIVIEIAPKAVYAVVTVETSRTKGQCVGGHESQIYLTMAGVARLRHERCYIACMTVCAGKWLTRGPKLMRV